MMNKEKDKNNFGYTLPEVLVVIAIFAMAMIGLSALVISGYRAQNYTFQQATAINEARRGIETMIKEIREAQTGADGSYLIEKADDNEFIFYSDIDVDGDVERVRYFIGNISQKSNTATCVTFVDGGACSAIFSNYLGGTLESANVTVSVEGDFGGGSESAAITADSVSLGSICGTGCNDCAGDWQGSTTYDVTPYAGDDSILFVADSTSSVNDFCDWQETNHAMKAKFEFSWTENIGGGESDFKKGVTEPTGWPPVYDLGTESISTLSEYLTNGPAVFSYFDEDGNEIATNPARPEETTLMRLRLIVNVNPDRAPDNFDLESDIQLRNLKTNL
jgi:prepilin-type N-terminal cleavage/methylation domain-containing protein